MSSVTPTHWPKSCKNCHFYAAVKDDLCIYCLYKENGDLDEPVPETVRET